MSHVTRTPFSRSEELQGRGHIVAASHTAAPCGLRGCNIGPAPLPGRMSYKATKPGLVSVLYLSMFLLCWCLLGPLFMYC